MSNLRLRSEILKCVCHSKEHEIEFAYDDTLFYCFIHLTPKRFFQRLKNGIKYIFGHRSIYGDFEEILFDLKELKKLDSLIHDFSFDSKHFMEGEKTTVISKDQPIDMV